MSIDSRRIIEILNTDQPASQLSNAETVELLDELLDARETIEDLTGKRKKPQEPGYCSEIYTDSSGETWDLNDPTVFHRIGWFEKKYLEMDADELRHEIEDQIGRSLYYMMCWDPDTDWGKQAERVRYFGLNFALEVRELDRSKNRHWLLKKLVRILDETENQC